MAASFLRLKVLSCDGGDYSSTYSVNNCFHDNESTYCSSKSSNINIVLTHPEGKRFTINEVISRAPGSTFTAPLKNMMVFVTNSVPNIHDFASYDNFTRNKYEHERRAGGGATAALFLQLPCVERGVASVCSPMGLTGRFVVLKLISSHREHNIDIEYIGFKGIVETSYNDQRQRNINNSYSQNLRRNFNQLQNLNNEVVDETELIDAYQDTIHIRRMARESIDCYNFSHISQRSEDADPTRNEYNNSEYAFPNVTNSEDTEKSTEIKQSCGSEQLKQVGLSVNALKVGDSISNNISKSISTRKNQNKDKSSETECRKTLAETDPKAIDHALTVLLNMLRGLKPLQLFSEWAPPRQAEDEAIHSDETDAFSSETFGPSNGPERALQSDYGHWRSIYQPENAYWGILLTKPNIIPVKRDNRNSTSSKSSRNSHTANVDIDTHSEDPSVSTMSENNVSESILNNDGVAISSISVHWHGRWKPATLHIEYSKNEINNSNLQQKSVSNADDEGVVRLSERISDLSVSDQTLAVHTSNIANSIHPSNLSVHLDDSLISDNDVESDTPVTPVRTSTNTGMRISAARPISSVQRTIRNTPTSPLASDHHAEDVTRESVHVVDSSETTVYTHGIAERLEDVCELNEDLSDSGEVTSDTLLFANGSPTLPNDVSPVPSTISEDDAEEEKNEWVTLLSLPSSRLDESRYVLPFSVHAKKMRLRMEGFDKNNKEGYYAIERVQLRKHKKRRSLGVLDCLNILQRWLSSIISKSYSKRDLKIDATFKEYPNLYWKSLNVLQWLALASGSLQNMLSVVESNLGIHRQNLNSSTNFPGMFFLPSHAEENYKMFLARLIERVDFEKRCHAVKEEDERKEVGETVGKSSSNVIFDSLSISHPGLVIAEGGLVVNCTTGSNASILLDIGFSSGKAAWEFELAEDTTSQCTCFGAATKPVTNHNYERSPDLWMYRAYNGYLYNRGTRDRTCRRVYKGDIVRCELDMDEGTLQYIVNGEAQGVAFSNMNQFGEVFPAIAFYSSGRSVRLVKVECMGSSPPRFLADILKNDMLEVSLGVGKKIIPGQLGYTVQNSELCQDNPMSIVSGSFENPTEVESSDIVFENMLDADSNLTRNSLDDGCRDTSKKKTKPSIITVQGKDRKLGISMHPPPQGRSWMKCCIHSKYDLFVASVALNDSASADELKRAGVQVSFEIKGDGKSLWMSKPIRLAKQMQQCSISVIDVEVLELVVHCPGANDMAHAVWVDPALVLESKRSVWYRNVYGSVGIATIPRIQPIVSNNSYDYAVSVLECLGQLSDVYLRQMRSPPPPPTVSWEESIFDLESPYAIQVSTQVFEYLANLINRFRKELSKAVQMRLNNDICNEGITTKRSLEDQWIRMLVNILKVMSANFRRMEVSHVDPAEVGFALAGNLFEKSVLPQLRDIISSLTGTMLVHNGKDIEWPEEVTLRAIETMRYGRRMLIPSPIAVGKQCSVVEFEVCWPVFDRNIESTDVTPAYERALVLLQIMCCRRGWRHRFIGEWMRIAYLVIEVPSTSFLLQQQADNRKQNQEIRRKPNHFLDTGGDFANCLLSADFKDWCYPHGDVKRLPIQIEPTEDWNRAERLAYLSMLGCIHVYCTPNRSKIEKKYLFDKICKNIQNFKPWEKLRKK